MVITEEIYNRSEDAVGWHEPAADRCSTAHLRNTVKKYWDGDSAPWERKDYSRKASVLTGDVVTFVRQCLEEDAHSPRKQHHTAKRIYERLVEDCGFTGGEPQSDGWFGNSGRSRRKPSCHWHSLPEMPCRSTGVKPRFI